MAAAYAQSLEPTLPAPALPKFITLEFGITLLIIGLAFIILAVLLYFLRQKLRSGKRVPMRFRNVVLLVTVPKEAAEQEEREERATPETLEQKLSPAEALMNVLGGMRAQRGFGAFLFGRHDHFSFEIVADRGLISFYVTVPLYLQQYMEQQIHAQYPAAQIEEVEDYNIFRPRSTILGTTLKLKKPYIFPIQTYRTLNVDPLSSLTNTLSKIGSEDGAAIQFVCRSAKAAWHAWGARVAREMQQGKKLREAMGKRGALGLLYEIFRTFFPKKKPEEPVVPYKLSPMEEQIMQSLEQKTSKAGFDVDIRVIVSASNPGHANMYLKNIIDSFSQFTLYEYGNGFSRKDPMFTNRLMNSFIYRDFDERPKLVLNTEEMASLFHFPLPETETPNIRWLAARKSAPPVNVPAEGIILGKNIYRGEETLIRIKPDDRRRHVYIIGKSGTGKSVLMSNMIIHDILNGEGVGVIDPHGDLINAVLPHIPDERVEDVIYFNPSDMERPMGLNMLEAQTPEEKDFAVQEMVAIFYKLFPPEMIGPMFEHNMRNVMLTLMEDAQDPGTIAEIPRMFTDPAFQKYKLQKVKDPIVRSFWEKEMAKTSDFHKSEMLGYLISKVGRFVENSMMRNIIGQPRSGFDFDDVMDKRKILLVNLAKGTTGEVNSSLLGLIITSKLQMASMRRVAMPQEARKDFYLYLDEFQNFVTDSIATILSEARKYRLNLTIAHQFISQLVQGQDTKIRDAVFGNVGTMIAFRVGVEDAETIAQEFAPVFNEYDVMNVEMFTANVKLLIDNTASRAFNMKALAPQQGDLERANKIIELSRLKYGRARASVEQEILRRSKLGEPSATQGQAVGERNL